jgi:hypothetical protein
MRPIRASLVLSLLVALALHMSGCHDGTLRDNARESRLRGQENMARP